MADAPLLRRNPQARVCGSAWRTPGSSTIVWRQRALLNREAHVAPHTGRGGWTWYTGSAGWMYRLIVESLLGLRLEVDKLRIAPCLPADWKGFTLHYRYRETVYHITVLQISDGNDETSVTVDGVEQPDKVIPLVDDRQEHSVEVHIRAAGR